MSAIGSILDGIIRPASGGLDASLARYLLTLGFTADDQRRYASLAAKASAGTLTPAEQEALDAYLEVNDLLAVLHAKAWASLTLVV